MKTSDVLQFENCILISSMQHFSWHLKAVDYSNVCTVLEDGQSLQERSVYFFK